jgi:predicted O-methyltransferase YrrM
MDDYDGLSRPPQLPRLLEATRKVGFLETSDLLVGDLLRPLAATNPGGRLLEIRTGTGIATAWLLDGMDDAASPASVDRNSRVQALTLAAWCALHRRQYVHAAVSSAGTGRRAARVPQRS